MEQSGIETLVKSLTLQEKVSLLSGADMWHTKKVDRLDVPQLKFTDGPNGARGENRGSPVAAASFPVGTAMGATWNPDLIEEVGHSLAEETRSKGAHVLLGPAVNMHRAPLAGRNFEMFSEDPFLTTRLAVSYIRGVQTNGAGACIKHFVCNDQEFERKSINAEVPERALWEIYLPPFQAAVEEAGVWSVMTAYNRINGTYASEHHYLLMEILKGQWAFDGYVISDWTGTYSEDAAGNGLDLEMPGPGRFLGDTVARLVHDGKVDESSLDDSVSRLFTLMERCGVFDNPVLEEERAVDNPRQRELIRRVGREAIVLLKNDRALLPLDPHREQTIAVIGMNAKTVTFQGGGSSRVNPHYVVSPLEAIEERFRSAAKVVYASGCQVDRKPPLIDSAWLTDPEGNPGQLQASYYNNIDFEEPVCCQTVQSSTNMEWFGASETDYNPESYSMDLKGYLRVPESGRYSFALECSGKAELWIDHKQVFSCQSQLNAGSAALESAGAGMDLDLEAGRVYPLLVRYAADPWGIWRGLRLGCLPPQPEDPVGEAVELTRQADVVVVVAGLTAEWETEGEDRVDMDLPGEQNDLISRVAAANPHTIVVLNSGSPLRMPWLKQVLAVLQMWYLGQESGHALADILAGDVSPSGKLPTTFPRRLQDNPTYRHFPGENGCVRYEEGLFIGYRHYEKEGIEPNFPFGHGLSYTTFEYGGLACPEEACVAELPLQCSLSLTNSGERPGKEVVQVYVHDVESRLIRPPKELAAFIKTDLEPGETKTVSFTIDTRSLSYYDADRSEWVLEPGEFELQIGSSSGDIRLQQRFLLL
ncbi:MAG: glycoside hydrolase family 3 C-terminal domain-containing protein [Anaerolineales bacterium]|nr:glycoside hydrolase family 3 C-terminal domain-containing protein [Anaerolineales bacterium]